MPKKSGKEGFIAIVALGIFALLMLFGILVQQTVVNTYASVKDTDNHYQAQALADSMMSYMKYVMNGHEAGFSTPGMVACSYGANANALANEGGGQSEICQDDPDIASMVDFYIARGKEVQLKFEVKGRPADSEKVNTAKCGNFGNSCYVTPLGDGTAGSDRCKFYQPRFLPVGSQFVDSVIVGQADLDQLNYACNWNKITFGSNLGDRVAVPLYYDAAESFADLPSVISPFNSATPVEKRATKFVLRMRTPCLPCGLPVNGVVPDGTRDCSNSPDPMVCTDAQRYQLNLDDGDEMVVQWQIDGRCTVDGREQECGLVGYPEDKIQANLRRSGIYISTIINALNNNGIVLDQGKWGQPTYLSDKRGKAINSQQMLPSFTMPIFSLFLNHALTSDTGANIPYLEYQILTDKPIGNSSLKLESTVAIDGSSYTETIYKEMSKPLIDFAIQN